MGRLFHKTLQAVLGCSIALGMLPAQVKAHTGGCDTVKISDGFFTQTGNGNTFSSTATGAYQAQINVTNYASDNPLTIGNPNTVLPTGLSRSKVNIAYTVTLSDGTVIYDGDELALQASSFVYSSPLPPSFVVLVNVRVQEQSGLQTNTTQYSLSLDVSC